MFACEVARGDIPEEREALIRFAEQTSIEQWFHPHSHWLLPNTSICEWEFVLCNLHGSVDQLSLQDNNMKGFPSSVSLPPFLLSFRGESARPPRFLKVSVTSSP